MCWMLVMTEFLLDENVLGLARYLDGKVEFKKIGDEGCPSKESPDHQVARFAKEHNLVIVTNDEKLEKQCRLFDIACVSIDMQLELVKRVLSYKNTP